MTWTSPQTQTTIEAYDITRQDLSPKDRKCCYRIGIAYDAYESLSDLSKILRRNGQQREAYNNVKNALEVLIALLREDAK